MNSLDQRNLHSAVCREEACVNSVLLNHLWNVLEDEHLSSGNSCVRSWVRCSSVYELDSELFALSLDEVTASSERSPCHVTWEAVVNECLAAHVISLLSDSCTLVDLVDREDDVSTLNDIVSILLWCAVCDQKIVFLS